MMNSLNKAKAIGLAAATALVMAPGVGFAEVSQKVHASEGGQSIIQRVSHSLAESKSYSRSGNAGYKWGKTADNTEPTAHWDANSSTSGGFKWKQSVSDKQAAAPALAVTSSFKWGSMSFSEQAAYRWGVRSFADQSAYRWGVRSDAEQSAYRWGVRSVADQAAYRWGVRSIADQAAYRWGVRSTADQAAYRWGVRSVADQAAYRWGVR